MSAWIDAQLSMPMPSKTHKSRYDETGSVNTDVLINSWWKRAMTTPDQLRARMAFALSEIFVVSMADPNVFAPGAAMYYDMLERNAFGSFRKLLEDVTLSPMMGSYLTYIGNHKEDLAAGRMPDENYAREIMQLMSIGLHQLNADGTAKLDGSGQPIPTYTSDDIRGLAKVFTGIGWWNPGPDLATFNGEHRANPDTYLRNMIFYPAFHSTAAKTFLGVTIPASSTADVAGDVKTALDTLFNHPNTGPFIASQLIQRMVTSNPSPGYVGRVAAVFANNGSGVRGDLGAVAKAILVDAEARDPSTLADPTFGKVREPLVRVTAWLRAFGATSKSGEWIFYNTSQSTQLAQSPMYSPSVFNFFRPGFTPPGTTRTGSRGLRAPEFQLVDEVSTAAWVINQYNGVNGGVADRGEVQPNYSAEISLAGNPSALADRMNLLLFYGQMSATLKSHIVSAVQAIDASNSSDRAKMAIFLSTISAEFMIQH